MTLLNNNNHNNFDLLKWILFAVFFYLNLGFVLGIVGNGIEILISALELPVWAHKLNDISIALLRIAVFIYLFVYLYGYKNTFTVNLSVNRLLLINLILLPVLYLLSLGLVHVFNIILAFKNSVSTYAEYAQFRSITNAVSNFLNIVMLVVFGIIALKNKEVSVSDTLDQ